MATETKKLCCRECGKRLTPDNIRDELSPYCGKCDPDGARFHYDIVNGRR